MKNLKVFSRILLTILCVSVFTSFSLPFVQAEDRNYWLNDQADLLYDSEEESIEQMCNDLSEKYQMSIAIVTTQDFKDPEIFGTSYTDDDILEWENEYFPLMMSYIGADPENGLLLAISMEDRDWGIQTFGSAQDVFTQYARETISSYFVEKLSDGDYEEAFETYLSFVDKFMTAAENGEAYSKDNPYKEYIPIPIIIGVSFIVSLIVAIIIVSVWKAGMNTRIRQEGATEYLKKGSFKLTGQSDIFLYHRLSRTRRESKSNNGSTTSSSSGTKGKF